MSEQTKTDADVFYSQAAEPALYHGAAHRVFESSAIEHLATPEEAKAIADDWMPTLVKYEISNSQRFAETIAELRSKPASATQLEAWQRETRVVLEKDYGDKAGAALRDAQKLIANDSKLRAFLNTSGAGSHPQIVRTLAASAAAARKAGKLA
ncbi:MAG: hypothetical protein V4645_11515 [Pseudomonadota bacterium]